MYIYISKYTMYRWRHEHSQSLQAAAEAKDDFTSQIGQLSRDLEAGRLLVATCEAQVDAAHTKVLPQTKLLGIYIYMYVCTYVLRPN